MTDKEYIEKLHIAFSSSETKDDMSDIDMLALLLSYTNCKSKLLYVLNGLISHFGSPKRCYFATYDALMSIDGMTRQAAILILSVARLYVLYDRSTFEKNSKITFEELFLSIVRYSPSEAFWAAAVDEAGEVVALERLAGGESAQVRLDVSTVLLFAGRYDARRIVLAHSHPDMEKPELSEQDIETMQYVGDSLDMIGITLLGQVVISGQRAKLFEYGFD